MNRRHRLRGRAAFAAVRAHRSTGSSPALRVGVAPNGGHGGRVGYAIPRAVGGAVERNRLRRRLRAAVRAQLGNLAGLDAVVSAFPPAAHLPWTELCSQLEACLLTAGARVEAARR